jgi:hypothetical protein
MGFYTGLWLTRFLRRKHLSFRRFTAIGRDLPSNVGENVRVVLGMCTPFLKPVFDGDTLLSKKNSMRQSYASHSKIIG